MKGKNMQVNSISNNTFGARIAPSEYLNKAIDLAKNDVASGTEEGIKRAATFYNSLRTIELDGSKKELSINNSYKYLPPILSLDGTKFFVDIYHDVSHKIGLAVQEAVNIMSEAKYFRGEMKNYAEKADLSKAFDKWLM